MELIEDFSSEGGNMDQTISYQTARRLFFRRVYAFMALALAVTGVTTFLAIKFFGTLLQSLIFSSIIGIIVIVVAQFALIFIIENAVSKNSPIVLFWLMLFSILEGVILTPIMYYTDMMTIILALLSASALFIVMAIIGMVSHVDVSRWGIVLMGTTIALIVVSLIQIFFIPSTMFQLIISWITIVIFSFWTMYDNRVLSNQFDSTSSDASLYSLAVSGALSLYLDFINLFLSFIRIFSNR